MRDDIAKFLLPGETVLSTFTGTVRLGLYHANNGVIVATDSRLVFAQTFPAQEVSSWWWDEFSAARVSTKMMSGEAALLAAGTPPATDALSAAASSLVVGGRKKQAAAIAEIADRFRGAGRLEVHSDAYFRPNPAGPDPRCGGCGGLPAADMSECSSCGRRLDWPRPLRPFTDALADPDSAIPEEFANGRATGAFTTLRSATLFAVASYDQNKGTALGMLTRWLHACQERTAVDPDSFGELPALRGLGDPDANSKLWRVLRKYPSWLAGEGPDHDVFRTN